MTKRVLLLCTLAVTIPACAQSAGTPVTPPPAHPITAAQVQEMLQLTGAAKLQKQMLDNIMPALRKTMPPYMPADVMTDWERTVLGPEMQNVVVRTYQQHISTEDAAAAIAFYKSPAGQRVLAVMPMITQQVEQQGAQIGMQAMTEVLARHKQEIEAAKQKYEQQHPWAPPKD